MVGNVTVKKFLQEFDAKEMYIYLKNRSRRKRFRFHHFPVFTRCLVSGGWNSVFKIYRFQHLPAKMCRFRVNGRPIRHIFHHFQNVPVSCERSLILKIVKTSDGSETVKKVQL